MNYSQKVLFDDWIKRCPIDGVFVDEPTSVIKQGDKWSYLIKIFLMIDKEDWEQNQFQPGISENSENLPSQNRFEGA